MTPETAGSLSRAVDDLHYSTRVLKYEVLAAIVAAGLANPPAIEADLLASREQS